jgi:hypothetical protein
MHRSQSTVRHVAVLAAALAGCANPEFIRSDGSTPGEASTGPCSEGQRRCSGQSWQECKGGSFATREVCAPAKVCVGSKGCLDCDPTLSKTCVGNDVHACSAAGQIGALIEKCGAQTCKLGFCGSQSCSQGTGLIYLVDNTNRFLSFNPENGANTLKELGQLSCAASASWPAWPQPVATPFSMSVDRKGKAWVLYTSGEVFWVDIKAVDCKPTPLPKGKDGYQLFGMGFVSNAKGSDQEKLFIHGGEVGKLEKGNLAFIDTAALVITTVGPVGITGSEHSPELTGTGNGELYGFFPNGAASAVRKISKTDGKTLQSWTAALPAGGDVVSWAFAHWGGKFYIFVTLADLLSETGMVLLLDPDTGSTTTLLKDTKYRIVGAGVSTCAPTID